MKLRHFNAKFDLKTENEICKLYQEGVHNGSVTLAKQFRCCHRTILHILKRHKVKSRNHSTSQINLKVGENSNHYKGGSTSGNGYKRIYVDKRCVQEHRYLMELKLKRPLTTKEVVHHINGNKLDNRIENLELMGRADHLLHHKIWEFQHHL